MTKSACRRADPLPRALFTACRHAACPLGKIIVPPTLMMKHKVQPRGHEYEACDGLN
jgi:hypothetical protein